MDDVLEVEFASEQWHLLAQGGLFWPKHRMLLVADTHLGKEATFRHHHIPVPAGGTLSTLDVIDDMLRATAAETLVFLGDLIHASSSLSSDVCAVMDSFFERNPHLFVRLTLGNHDRHAEQLLERWPMEIADEFCYEHIQLAHFPANDLSESRLPSPRSRIERLAVRGLPIGSSSPNKDTNRNHRLTSMATLRICGHLHPAIRLTSSVDALSKLPCFWLHGDQLVLPAIGRFTGTQLIKPAAQDRLWLLAEGRVVEFENR